MRRILLLPVMLFLLTSAAYGQQAFTDGQVGVPYTFNVDLSCAFSPCNGLHLTAGALPPGLNFGSGSTAFSIVGIPTKAGVFYFTIEGGQNIGPASITILNGPPAIVPEVLPNPGVGVPYDTLISGVGGTPPYKWSVESGSLPPGLSLASSSAGGVIAGTPSQGGVYMANVMFTDANGTTSPLGDLKMTVSQIIIRSSPSGAVISALPDGEVGTSYSAQFAVQYGSGSFTISSGSLPPGLVLDPGGALSGTPTAAGTFPFTVAAGGAQLAVSINVASLIPTFSNTTLPGGTVGQFYYQRLSVSGGSPPYTYTATGVPSGLTFNLGLFSGTPTVAGTFPMTLTATDTVNHTGSTQLALTIYPPLTLGTASPLPPATAGQPYSQTISVTGGQPPYSFTLSGAAPNGFAINSGVLSGTPAAPASYNFSIQVTDKLQNVVSQSYQLTVGPPRPSIVPGGILNAASFAEDSKGHGTASAPGSLVSIYGNYPGATQATADMTAALPTSLGGASVTFNGVAAPLVSIFPSGSAPVINAQIPFEVLTAGNSSGQPSGTASVIVTVNGQSSPPQSFPIATFAPGIFTIPPNGLGTAILIYVDPADQMVKIAAPASASATLGFPAAPIPRGVSGFFYVTGLGAMAPAVADGDGGGTVTHFANVTPVVLVGGAVATEIFAGQAPGYPGIGQVNITIPSDAPVGDTVSLQLQTADGTALSNIATIAVQ